MSLRFYYWPFLSLLLTRLIYRPLELSNGINLQISCRQVWGKSVCLMNFLVTFLIIYFEVWKDEWVWLNRNEQRNVKGRIARRNCEVPFEGWLRWNREIYHIWYYGLRNYLYSELLTKVILHIAQNVSCCDKNKFISHHFHIYKKFTP